MSRLDFSYVDQDCAELASVSYRRPSDTVRERQRGPRGEVPSGCDRPYFQEMAQKVAGRCACCGTKLRSDQGHCPVCYSVNSRIGSKDS